MLGSLEGLGRVLVALGALPAVLLRLFRHSKDVKKYSVPRQKLNLALPVPVSNNFKQMTK